MTPKVKKFLQELVIGAVEELLDDPAGVYTSDEGLLKYLKGLKAAASFLGLDYNKMLMQNATDFTYDRLQEAIALAIKEEDRNANRR